MNQIVLPELVAQESVSVEVFYALGIRVEHYIPAASGPGRPNLPIVLEPGMFSGNWIFRKFAHGLAERGGFEVYCLSLRGHGDSRPVKDLGKVRIDEYVDDLRGFVKSLGRRVILIGHSMGGLIGSQVANEPEVAAFIDMMSAPSRGMLMGWECVKRIAKYLKAMLAGKEFNLVPADARALLFNRLDDEGFERAIRELYSESGMAAWELLLWKYIVPRVSCPTLVVKGKFDKITPNQKGIKRRLGAGTFVEIPTSHMFMCDKDGIDHAINAIVPWLGKIIPQLA